MSLIKAKKSKYVHFSSIILILFTVGLSQRVHAQAYTTPDEAPQFSSIQKTKKGEQKSGTYINWSGHYRARALVQDNVTSSSDYIDQYSHRLRINGDFSPSDDIKAHFSANLYGLLGGNRRGFIGLDQSTIDPSADDHELQLLRAYGEWDFWRGFHVNFGRQQISWVNEAVISKNEDDDRPYSFDGLIINYSDSAVNFKVGALRLGDWSSQSGDDLDPSEDSYFISVQLDGFNTLMQEAQLFFYRTQSDDFEDTDLGISIEGGSFNRFGLSLNGENSFLYYTLDYVNLSGEFSNGVGSSANMAHIKLGGIWGAKDQLRTFAILHADSGDEGSVDEDEGYRPLYYNHHKYGGLMDLLAWGNLTYYGVGVEYKPSDDQLFLVQALTFQRSDSSSGVSSIDYLGFDQGFITEEINQNSNSINERDLGIEIDFLYKKNYGERAFIEFIGGVFLPAGYFESYDRDKNIYSVRLTTGFSF